MKNKIKYVIASLFAILVSMVGCDKGFEELNKDPLSPTTLDPAYELTNVQPMAQGRWHYEGNIVQQINLIITGQEAAGNHNIQKDNIVGNTWSAAYGRLKTIEDMLKRLEGTPRTNLYNIAKLLKAWNYMLLVDSYGDVPYSEAIKGYYTGNFFPKYDNQRDVYAALESMIIEATDGLSADYTVADKIGTASDMFYQGDIAKWKKLGNSLLLRYAMRYTEIDPAKAQRLVQKAIEAGRGGVISTNAENVTIPYNNTQNNPVNNFERNSTKQNWHASKPFVDFLKTNNDPRMPYWIVLYADPNSATGGTKNNNVAVQIGAPVGYDPTSIASAPGYPGEVSSGIYKYSMFDRQIIGRGDNIAFLMTAAQTQLLLADAAKRGWIPGGDAVAQTYYNSGITLNMKQPDIYSTTRNGASPITDAQINAYLAQPNIAYTAARALEQINTQFWVASFLIWDEAWANFRRSNYPVLARNPYPGADPAVIASPNGFINRMTYPVDEYNYNRAKVEEAADNLGGDKDKLSTRVFWDAL